MFQLFSVVLIAVLTAGAPAAQQLPQPVQQLEQRRPVERTLGAKETHAYTIALEAGQFLDAVVNQRGLDVIVRVFSPAGTLVAEIDSPNGAQGDEPIALEAKAAGMYRIEVSPLATPRRVVTKSESTKSCPRTPTPGGLLSGERNRKQLVVQLKENAVLIKTVEAGSGFADLMPLKKVSKTCASSV